MFDFSGEVTLVSGATGALGGAVARRFLAAGAAVETVDRDGEKARRLLADAAAERLTCHSVDFADAEAVAARVEEIVRRRGRVDHLVNAVGGFAWHGPVDEAPADAFDRMLDANFRSTFHLCRAVVPVMRRQGAGTIVNVGSRASLAGDANVAAYAVAKSAVMRLTESLAAEGKRQGVRVNCVLPGTLDTEANRRAMPAADAKSWVEVDALVDVVCYLSSPAARAIHGAAVPVFGLE